MIKLTYPFQQSTEERQWAHSVYLQFSDRFPGFRASGGQKRWESWDMWSEAHIIVKTPKTCYHLLPPTHLKFTFLASPPPISLRSCHNCNPNCLRLLTVDVTEQISSLQTLPGHSVWPGLGTEDQQFSLQTLCPAKGRTLRVSAAFRPLRITFYTNCWQYHSSQYLPGSWKRNLWRLRPTGRLSK